jgi:hypothetical protein
MESKNIILPKGEKRNILNPSMFSKNYMNPPIMDGYRYVEGCWYNGFVIERISDGSQCVWIPVGFLDSDGKLYKKLFPKNFDKRRNKIRYLLRDKYDCRDFFCDEWLEQGESLKKYGGFYISRYPISKNSQGKPQSIKGVHPWVWIDIADADRVSESFENKENVKSHIMFEKEFDLVVKWLKKSKAISKVEYWDHRERGGYMHHLRKKLMKTGSYKKLNNIYDFSLNVDEFVMVETKKCSAYAVEGLYEKLTGIYYFEAWGCEFRPGDSASQEIGFRIALYVKP